MTGSRRILVVDIAIGERVRPIDPRWVAGLADEIKASGTRQPHLKDMIEVRPVKRKTANPPPSWGTPKQDLNKPGGTPKTAIQQYEIVTGAHRLEAVRLLGWTEIEARVLPLNRAKARLREIDDHIKRKSLTVLAMGRALSEMKRVYLERYPETRNGAQGGRGGQKIENDNLSFSKKTAEALELSPRTIDRYIAVFTNIFPAVAVEIEAAGHKIADNQSELARLGMIEPVERQMAVIQFILNPAHPATSVTEALATLKKQPMLQKTPEYRMIRWWDKADIKTRQGFIDYLIMDGALADYGLGPEVLEVAR